VNFDDLNGEIAAVLERAAAVLEERGWAQFYAGYRADDYAIMDIVELRLYQPEEVKACCAAGAIALATGDDVLYARARDSVCDHVGFSRMALWNDTPGRTREDVIRAFRETAADLRA